MVSQLNLPWGIRIDEFHRIAPWRNMYEFPYEFTRFHPAFAYEMLWNFLAAGLLLWIALEFKKKIKPATIFAGWLILEGVGREIIEFFRPDQPRIPGTDISYSRVVAGIMVLVGIFWLLIKYEIIKIPGLKPGPKNINYQLGPRGKLNSRSRKRFPFGRPYPEIISKGAFQKECSFF